MQRSKSERESERERERERESLSKEGNVTKVEKKERRF